MANRDLMSWPTNYPMPGDKNINPIGYYESLDKRTITYGLSHKHMIETIERFVWKNLPAELTSDLIERILYFRSKGAFFKGVDEKFRFLPFALDGQIDIYGRYMNIVPVLFTGQKTNSKTDRYYFNSDKALEVCYEVGGTGEAVILNNSSLEISQDNTPEFKVVAPIIEQLTEILVLINMDLISSAKVFYIVASDEGQKQAIEAEFESMDQRILSGKRVVVVTSPTELQELNSGRDTKDSSRYFQVYQSFDNLRKDLIGSANSGTFMKNSIQTDSEVNQNKNTGSAVLNNALRQRKEFCDLVNALFSLNIQVELAENDQNETVAPESNNSLKNEGTIEEDEYANL